MALRPNALNLISLCTGGGGLDRAVELAIPTARPIVCVERESFSIASLVAQIENGLMAPAAIWSNVRTFNGRRLRGLVDGLIGGIPCQGHSLAGRRQGSLDERDLWSPTRRIIAQARPWFVLIENVGGMLSAGADEVPGAYRVRRDLRKLGYSVTLIIVRADQMGLPHERLRVFILGVADWFLADGDSDRRERAEPAQSTSAERRRLGDAQGDGRREGRPEPELRRGRGSATGDGGAVVYPFGGRHDGRPEGAIGEPVGRGADERSGARPFLRPPGPGDFPAWQHVSLVAPGLLPAVSRYDRLRLEMGAQGFVAAGDPSSGAWLDAQTGERVRSAVLQAAIERAVRGVADVMAPRIDELRMLGNGVAEAQGALAVGIGAHELAARGSAGAALLVRLMEAA